MKNVPGWVVGTWYGDPLYRTIGNFLLEPSTCEYYAHVHPKREEEMHRFELWF